MGQAGAAAFLAMLTLNRDEEAIRAYIRNQEKEDQRLDQLNLWR